MDNGTYGQMDGEVLVSNKVPYPKGFFTLM